jgi:hypothetical protein
MKDFIDVLEILKNKMNKKIVLEMIANLVEIFFLKFQSIHLGFS